jgi:REP-associated tyrosine transposase
MSHKYPNLLIHCVFSTKGRRDLIPNDLQPKLFRYLNGIGSSCRMPVLAAGGTGNHVHLLMVLPSAISVAKAVQTFKSNSSRWIREHGIDFAWQDGYGAFTVSASQREVVRRYVERQKDHHAKRTFEDEFLALIARSGVTHDRATVFD